MQSTFKTLGSLLIFSFVFFVSHTFTFAQNIKEKHQLLWEISGNGLEEPSYLYGTIHLADQRAFEFSDSVLLKLEGVDAFAMELLPDDIMRFMFEEIMTHDPLNKKKWIDAIGEERYNRLEEWMESNMQFPLAAINIEYSWALSFLFQSSDAKTPKKGDKATFLDGHLYQLAKIQGKEVLSLEDVKDQLSQKEEVDVNRDVEKLERYINREDGKEKKEGAKQEINQLLEIYREGDLEKIDEYIQKYDKEDSFVEHEHMIKRNIKMANRIEEYTKSQTIFAAVGAAHLAGKGSIIDLLQQKGFTLQAVPAVFTGLADKYEVKESAKKAEWTTFSLPDVAAQIDFPTQPYTLKLADVPSFFRGYTYPDIGEGLTYVVMSIDFPPSTTSEMVEQIFEDYPTNMTKGKNGKIIRQETISLGEYKGYDVTILENETEYGRYQLFRRGNTIFANALTTTQKELLQGENATRFFSSFKINEVETPAIDNTPSTPTIITSKQGAFQVKMPHEVEAQIRPMPDENGEISGKMHIYQDTEIVGRSEIVYVASYQNFEAGWFIEEDKNIFESVLQNVFERLKVTPDVRDTSIMGYPAKLATARAANQNIDYLLVIRGNRAYMVFVLVGGEDQPDKRRDFMDSFELLKEQVSEPELYKSSLAPISFLVFHEPTMKEETIRNYQKTNTHLNSHHFYNSSDKNTGINYTTSIYQFTPYAKFENEDSLFNQTIELLCDFDSDSLISSERKRNQGALEWSYVSKSPKVHTFKRGKFILKDGILYELSTFLPKESLYSELNNRFFNEIHFDTPAQTIDLYSDKSDLLLNDLLSENEETQQLANAYLSYQSLENASFERLQTAFEKDYSQVEEDKHEIKKTLMRKMYVKDSLKTSHFIKAHYSEWADTNSCQLTAIQMLLNMKEKETTRYVKKLLLNERPLVKGNQYKVNYILSNYVQPGDDLKIENILFPEILELMEDDDYRAAVMSFILRLKKLNRLKKEHLLPYEAALLKQTKTAFAALDTISTLESYHIHTDYAIDYVTLLNYLDDREKIIPLLKQLERFPFDEGLQFAAVDALLKIDAPVEVKVLEKLAKTPFFRIGLYKSMKASQKLDLFPASYKTQEALAESVVYNEFVNKWETYLDTIVLLEPRSMDYKGKKHRVFLYKLGLERISFESESEESNMRWILGISDLYPWNKQELDAAIDYHQINFEPLTDESLEEIYQKLLKSAKEEAEANTKTDN